MSQIAIINSVIEHKTRQLASLGKLSPSKTDEFSEKFQTAYDPPPPPLIFGKLCCKFFSEIHDRSIVYNGKNLQYKFLD